MSHFRLFLIASLGMVFLAHFFFYLSVINFFNITGVWQKRTAGGLLAFLAVGFILASYLAHLYDNVFTRSFYYLAGLWLGAFLYLLMAAAAAWVVIALFRLSGSAPSSAFIGGVLLGVAVLYSAYGVWNAAHPRIREVRVEIKGLPESWKGKTIVQISDVHLGHVYRADFMRGVVEKVNALKPDIVAITGDLFDGMDGALYEIAAPLKGLRAPYGVYFVTGNHETYLGVDKVYAVMKGVGVEALKDEVRVLDGLQLAGISYRRRGETRVPAEVLRSIPGYVPGRPTVMLYHSPVDVGEAGAAGVGLQLSGHTHKGQLFPFNFITSGIYDGLDYGLHRFGDYSIYTTGGVGTWGPPMRTGNAPEVVRVTLD